MNKLLMIVCLNLFQGLLKRNFRCCFLVLFRTLMGGTLWGIISLSRSESGEHKYCDADHPHSRNSYFGTMFFQDGAADTHGTPHLTGRLTQVTTATFLGLTWQELPACRSALLPVCSSCILQHSPVQGGRPVWTDPHFSEGYLGVSIHGGYPIAG